MPGSGTGIAYTDFPDKLCQAIANKSFASALVFKTMSNLSKDLTMPGTRLLLRISVLLPIASVFVLGLTAAWQQARIPDTQIIVLTIVALLPALIVYLPFV